MTPPVRATIDRTTPRERLVAIVAGALHHHGIEVVLVGGSVAAIYSSEKYVTYDLDFVLWAPLERVAAVLAPLGFRMNGRLARHAESDFVLDFVSSPVLVGHKYVSDEMLVKRRTPDGAYRLLSPLDCVLDRLSAFLYYEDRQGLEQAVAIARRRRVSLAEVRRWTREEGQRQRGRASAFDEALREFERLLGARR